LGISRCAKRRNQRGRGGHV